jgi:hypothetical protein
MPLEQSTLTIGTLLRERYLIKNVPGSEKNGAVYLVKDNQVKRIKYNLFVLKEITALDPDERFSSIQDFWQALNAIPSVAPAPFVRVPEPAPVRQEVVPLAPALAATEIASDVAGQSKSVVLSSAQLWQNLSSGPMLFKLRFLQRAKDRVV